VPLPSAKWDWDTGACPVATSHWRAAPSSEPIPMHPPATTPRFDLAVAPSTVRPPKAQGPAREGTGSTRQGRPARAASERGRRQATRCRARPAVASGPAGDAADGGGRRTDGDEKHGAAAMDVRLMDGWTRVRADADAAVLCASVSSSYGRNWAREAGRRSRAHPLQSPSLPGPAKRKLEIIMQAGRRLFFFLVSSTLRAQIWLLLIFSLLLMTFLAFCRL